MKTRLEPVFSIGGVPPGWENVTVRATAVIPAARVARAEAFVGALQAAPPEADIEVQTKCVHCGTVVDIEGDEGHCPRCTEGR